MEGLQIYRISWTLKKDTKSYLTNGIKSPNSFSKTIQIKPDPLFNDYQIYQTTILRTGQ